MIFKFDLLISFQEVKRVAGAGVEDVHADPHLMDKCARDINKYCDHVSQKDGEGQCHLFDL